MSFVIFNADDFGITDGVSRGIVDCGASGLTMSTTAMTCVDGAAATVAKYAPRFAGSIGLHLQLSDDKPVSAPGDVPTLVGPDGLMNGLAGAESWDPAEVAKEWRAQVARLRSWGIEPDHLDCHRHLHLVAPTNPHILAVYAALANELGVPARGGNRAVAQALRAKGVACPDLMIEFARFSSNPAAMLNVLKRHRSEGPDLRVVHRGRLGDHSPSRFERDVIPLTRINSFLAARQRIRRGRRAPLDGAAACADRRLR